MTRFTGLGMTLATLTTLTAIVLAPVETQAAPAATTVAQAAPTPKPKGNPFVINGYLRAYDFTRQNASNNPGFQYAPPPAKYKYNSVNQQSFAAGVAVHAGYSFLGSGFSIGGTYLFSDPLTSCDLVLEHTKGSPCISQTPPGTNPDDTLAGYQLSTLYEAYLQYARSGFYAKMGNQVINTPWANASDSRIKPVAFQGADLSYSFGPWTLEGMDMLQFQSRTSSFFSRSTLLTSFPPTGNNGVPGNYTPPGNVTFASSALFGKIPTDGFAFGRIGYANHYGFSGDLEYYGISNIASILWLDGKYAWRGPLSPFAAIQVGNETNAGASVIGKIDSRMYGLQAGVNLLSAVQFVAGFDDLPWKSDSIALPAGVSCSAATHELSIPTPAAGYYTFPYFIANNVPQCVPGAAPGTATVFYGGWASPYTDSYATDPMFTTSMTQGVADRHVAGTSLKFALVFTSPNHRFVGLISHAVYNAGNAGGDEQSSENNLDALYYLNRVVGGQRYRGLLLRYRYGERFFTQTQVYGGLPIFKYNRAQLEYDF